MTKLAWIQTLLPLVEKFVGILTKAIADAKRTGELTEAQEAEFKTRLDNLTSQEHWKTDAERIPS